MTREEIADAVAKVVLPAVRSEVEAYRRMADEMLSRLSNHIHGPHHPNPGDHGFSPTSPNRCPMCGKSD